MSRYHYTKAGPASGYKYTAQVGSTIYGLARTIGGWRAEALSTKAYIKGYGMTRELAVQDAVANGHKHQRRINGPFGPIWETMASSHEPTPTPSY